MPTYFLIVYWFKGEPTRVTGTYAELKKIRDRAIMANVSVSQIRQVGEECYA